jgi:hypothetical protein
MSRGRRGHQTRRPKPIATPGWKNRYSSTQNVGKSRFPPLPRDIARQATISGISCMSLVGRFANVAGQNSRVD